MLWKRWSQRRITCSIRCAKWDAKCPRSRTSITIIRKWSCTGLVIRSFLRKWLERGFQEDRPRFKANHCNSPLKGEGYLRRKHCWIWASKCRKRIGSSFPATEWPTPNESSAGSLRKSAAGMCADVFRGHEGVPHLLHVQGICKQIADLGKGQRQCRTFIPTCWR